MRRARGGLLLAGLLAAVLVAPAAPTGATGTVAGGTGAAGGDRYAVPVVAPHATNPDNPLAGRAWGVYRGAQEQAWAPYTQAIGESRELLAEIALRPKAKWFGSWVRDDQIAARVRDYVAVSQAGDRDALVQMAFFRVRPWGSEMCGRLPTVAERASYRRWIDEAARGIGSAHTAVVLQPDMLIMRCAPDGGRASAQLVAYAARTLSALPHTAVYLDAGAWDWPHPSQGGARAAVDHLVKAGIRRARGVALNSTHYSDVRLEVTRAAELVAELDRRGITGTHAVISTTSNGRPFEFGKYTPQASRDNARVCASPTDTRMCVTLGIPPSMDPGAETWGLGASLSATAARVVDGYLWYGRPWLHDQADPFVVSRAHALVRSWSLRPGTP